MLEVYPSSSQQEGMISMIKAFGIGPIQPNTIVMNLEHDNPDIEKLVGIIDTCRTMQKNLILFKVTEHAADKRFIKPVLGSRKRIDLWWDGSSNKSFDLTVSLVTTMYDNKSWRKSQVNLNVVSPHAQASDPLKEYIQNFVTQSRLKMTPCIHYEQDATDYLPLLKKYSLKADLTFVPLDYREEDQTIEGCRRYLEKVIAHTKNLGVCALTLCFDQVDHSEIYYYPQGRLDAKINK